MTTWAELIAGKTVAQALTDLEAALTAAGLPVASWRPGARIRTILAAVATVHSALWTVAGLLAKAGFREYATGEWLTLLAKQVYGLDRVAATFAAGTVTLTNAGGATYTWNIGDLTVQASAVGKNYTNTAAVTLGPSPDTQDVAVAAVEAGSGSTVAALAIDTMVTSAIGVTVSNAAALVGVDEETDDAQRTRCAQVLSTTFPFGSADAYDYTAKLATRLDGTSVGVTRTQVDTSSPVGTVYLAVATASGAVSGTYSDPATDLGAVNDAIQSQVVPLGVTCSVVSAVVVPVAVTYDFWFLTTSGAAASQVAAKIAAALATFFSAQPVGGEDVGAGGYCFANSVLATIYAANPYIIKATLTLPASDRAIADYYVATLGAISWTSHAVTP